MQMDLLLQEKKPNKKPHDHITCSLKKDEYTYTSSLNQSLEFLGQLKRKVVPPFLPSLDRPSKTI